MQQADNTECVYEAHVQHTQTHTHSHGMHIRICKRTRVGTHTQCSITVQEGDTPRDDIMSHTVSPVKVTGSKVMTALCAD